MMIAKVQWKCFKIRENLHVSIDNLLWHPKSAPLLHSCNLYALCTMVGQKIKILSKLCAYIVLVHYEYSAKN